MPIGYDEFYRTICFQAQLAPLLANTDVLYLSVSTKMGTPKDKNKYPTFLFLTFPIELSFQQTLNSMDLPWLMFVSHRSDLSQSPPVSWLLAWYRLNLGNWCVVIKHLLKVWWSKRNCCCFEIKVQVVCDIVLNTLWKDWTKQRCNEKTTHEKEAFLICKNDETKWKDGYTFD